MTANHLAIISVAPVWFLDGVLSFDRKFFDGVMLYTKYWSGKVTCIVSLDEDTYEGQDCVSVVDPPFDCIVIKNNETINIKHLNGVTIVLASGDAHDQFHISSLCRDSGIKCVYYVELTPEIRSKIIQLKTTNLILMFRRILYLWFGEIKRQKAFRKSDGLQINGVAAYDEYSSFHNSLFYLDSRCFLSDYISSKNLEGRLNDLLSAKPLRLVFSGRLDPIKGAFDLLKLAIKLRRRHIKFTLTIYGSGVQSNEMREFVLENDLSDIVFMAGNVDFRNQLLPKLRDDTDIFICLHKQSDPSCTYLETLSCGVPILGYNNRAFTGILDKADIGWSYKIDNLDGLVNAIKHLDDNRVEIATKSRTCLKFALEHDFEQTFKSRIEHLNKTSSAY